MNKCEHCGARWGFGDYQWVDVKDRLPKDKEEVILFINKKGKGGWTRVVAGMYDPTQRVSGFESYKGNNRYNCYITHWHPLPSIDSVPIKR